ncbi:MAG TPA: hypothetical protein VLM36_01545 [Sphingomicrobium sp.]|nr:hypothetical protein [Sphingomicrobium sp.]
MKFKKINPKTNSTRPSPERRPSELARRAFDAVAYAAALEILG